jgi:hypothetical protein
LASDGKYKGFAGVVETCRHENVERIVHVLGSDAEFRNSFRQIVVAVPGTGTSIHYRIHSAVTSTTQKIVRTRAKRVRRALQRIRN